MKYGMFAFLYTLMTVCTMNIVDDAGAGSDAGADNSQDGGADDAGSNENSNDGSDVGDTEVDNESSDGDASLSADEIRQAREIISEKAQNEVLSRAEGSIQSRVAGFKMSPVVAGLKELHKTDPARAAFYNSSEAGLEMYHRDHLANVAVGDDLNDGSHAGNGADFGDTLDKAIGGDKKSVKSALAQSKA